MARERRGILVAILGVLFDGLGIPLDGQAKGRDGKGKGNRSYFFVLRRSEEGQAF